MINKRQSTTLFMNLIGLDLYITDHSSKATLWKLHKL